MPTSKHSSSTRSPSSSPPPLILVDETLTSDTIEELMIDTISVFAYSDVGEAIDAQRNAIADGKANPSEDDLERERDAEDDSEATDSQDSNDEQKVTTLRERERER